ncbi:hypothetical protein DIS09_17465, partial [Burkholderia pseudomallei]
MSAIAGNPIAIRAAAAADVPATTALKPAPARMEHPLPPLTATARDLPPCPLRPEPSPPALRLGQRSSRR